MSRVSIVAHRGGAFETRENTLTAFRHAIDLGVDAIECDVHLMADGRVVVFHDFSLLQLTGEEGQTGAIDEARRQQLRIGGGDDMPPLLEDLVALLAKTPVRLYLEIKTNARPEHELQLAKKSCEILQAFDFLGRTSAISFDSACLTPLMAAGIPCGLCLDNPDSLPPAKRAGQLKQWWHEGYRDLSLNGARSSPDFIAQAVDCGFTVGVWTINGPARLGYWLRQGIDYITTDQPDLALRLRG